jgi:hypothetical protein
MQVSRILREFKMHYAKPYAHDYRRPENAEELFTESLDVAVGKVQGECIVGFMDQAAPQTRDNKQRFWLFVKSEWSFKETIRTTFHRLAQKTTFMTGWLARFQPILSNLL